MAGVGGMLEAWQTELQELLSNLTSQRHTQRSGARKKLHFRIKNCMDVLEETRRVTYMALPSNVIINIPILASVVADSPFNRDNPFFELEIILPGVSGLSLVIGAVNKDFKRGHHPGWEHQTIGFKVSDGSIHKESSTPMEGDFDKNAACCVQGDRVGCGVDFKEDGQHVVYFTKNNNRLIEVPFGDGPLELYPAFSMTSPKEEVKLLQDGPWRSNLGAESREGLKICRETGQISFRSTKEGGRDATLLASQPFSRQFSHFEIEILGLGEEDEVSIGGVPEEYSLRRLPGCRARSLGYFGKAGGIFPGLEVKRDEAPKCAVGDKMGCGVEYKSDGKRYLYFTHNSKSFMEAELNENCPDRLFPAVGLRSRGGTASVCLMDCANWGSAEDDADAKPSQVDMTSPVDAELGKIVVDKETARAQYTSPVGVTRDAILVSTNPLPEKNFFEIEILYGNLITIGLITETETLTVHPGWSETSIGYNVDSGLIYKNGASDPAAVKRMSTFGDRIGCGIKSVEDKQMVYFTKNSVVISEVEFGDPNTKYVPAIGMRSSGQVLAIRLLDRLLWMCDEDAKLSHAQASGGTSAANMEICKLLDRELIECPICRDIFTDPRILPCSVHTFCSSCIKQYIDQHQGKRYIPCPICQKMFTIPPGGVTDLPCNQTIVRLIEIRTNIANQ